MRVLVVSNLYPPRYLGGYEVLCRQVVDRLRARGHELAVLTSDWGTEPHAGDEDGVHVARELRLDVPFGRPGSTARLGRLAVARYNASALRRALRAHAPDVVFQWSQLRLGVGAARAAQEAGVPVLFTFNDDHLKSFVPAAFGWAPRRLARWLGDATVFRAATLSGLDLSHATCISRCLRDQLVAEGVPVGSSDVVYQGIPLERFPLKEVPGAVQSPPRILYAGQLHDYKGVHVLIEAVALLRGRFGRSLELTIAGDGEPAYRRRLEAAATAAGGATFLGRVPHDELPAVYRGHDLFVFPSLWKEPFGLTHLEAMASGLPVVSTTEGGTAEFLEDERNALTVPAGDAPALAAALGRLLDDRALAARLAAAGRRTVEEGFTLDRYAASLEQLLRRATGVAA